MPIIPNIVTNRITQDEFKELSFEVMRHVFDIHNEFGRFFDESVYKKELAARLRDVMLETSVQVVHETFTRTFFADVIVRGCGLFEFKAVDAIHPRHRSQVIHYLLLFDLPHGKLVNMHEEQVQHEFVNCNQRLKDRRNFSVHSDAWDTTFPKAEIFQKTLEAILRDWGTGLELSLYEDALTHFFGGEASVNEPVPVFGMDGYLVDQRMRLATANIAFKLTALSDHEDTFVMHARKLIRHTSLHAIYWANIKNNDVTFRTIR